MSFNLIDFLLSFLDMTVLDYANEVWGDQPWLSPLLSVIYIVVIATVVLLLVFVVGWTERKVLARMQDRIGPNRVGGRYGMLQMVADVVKMMTKEVIIPAGADRWAYLAAPVVSLATSILLFAVLPLAPGVVGVNLPSGIFYVMAISSVSIVGLLLAGWGSNNKYALLGAFRAVSQLVSYEVPLMITLLVPVILAGTLSLVSIVEEQTIPYFFYVPLAGIIFFISILAETGRSPFDLLEAESEIIAGFHIEYSGMYFGLFMAAEYIAIMFMSALFATVYWGGYNFFGLEDLVLANGFAIGRPIGFISLIVKIAIAFFIFMWVRATLPRFRIDQLLDFNWKLMVPLSLVLLFVVVLLNKAIDVYAPGITEFGRMSIHLLSNVIIGIVVLEIMRRRARRKREAEEGPDAGGWRMEPVLAESDETQLAHAD